METLPASFPSSATQTPSLSSDIKRVDHTRWMIKFAGGYFETTVTYRASEVDRWIDSTIKIHHRRLHRLLVGLDTEWCLTTKINKHQKVAIIQLCVGCRCLIFQLCHKDKMPQSLINFLGNNEFTFVGKGIQTDAEKLMEDYELKVARIEDVSHVAASKYDDEELSRMGLKGLVVKFLNVEIEKPKRITLSKWDRNRLSEEQIQYAAIDAFVSFKLAVELKEPGLH